MSAEQATILVVEDDVDIAEMLAAYFRAQAFDVLTVHWGEDALKACRSNHPDLVILDIRLPDIDGYEVARRLRTNRRTGEIPIIFLTERRERGDRLQGLELGADDYVTKPFDIHELRLRVRNTLRRATRRTLTNPVTGLAEGHWVDERLHACLSGTSSWAILFIALQNLNGFRESYGFVASDDVQRAVSLILNNAVRSAGGAGAGAADEESDFVGQVSPTEFIIITHPGNLPGMIERIRTRLDQSLEFFYPSIDRGWDAGGGGSDGGAGVSETAVDHRRLTVRISQVQAGDGSFASPTALKQELRRRGAH